MDRRGVAVVAVGGNSLIKDEAHQMIPDQIAASAESMHLLCERNAWHGVAVHGDEAKALT
ncbi:MAG: hypothetical protein HYU65_01480 [Armatimonadetes bacterium]|nr:hypothetical protein [Armatimonadota bacterium]